MMIQEKSSHSLNYYYECIYYLIILNEIILFMLNLINFLTLDSLFDKPELRLAVALVKLYGLRPAD